MQTKDPIVRKLLVTRSTNQVGASLVTNLAAYGVQLACPGNLAEPKKSKPVKGSLAVLVSQRQLERTAPPIAGCLMSLVIRQERE